MDNNYRSAVSLLSEYPKSIMLNLRESDTDSITEVRLRVGKPLAVSYKGQTAYVGTDGISFLKGGTEYTMSAADVTESFYCLCNHSVYSHENEISEGYISLPHGHRAGVCGTVVTKADGIFLQDISSINLRIARQKIGCAGGIIGAVTNKNVLICGAPHSGKTTLLRDLVRVISDRGEKVAILDTRGELAAQSGGISGLDVGVNTDVLTNCTKARGIENVLRSMNVDTIAFDEIGSREEFFAVSGCLSAGVRVITTLHAGNVEELKKRIAALGISDFLVFDVVVMLKKDYSYSIINIGDIYAETDGRDYSVFNMYGDGNIKISAS